MNKSFLGSSFGSGSSSSKVNMAYDALMRKFEIHRRQVEEQRRAVKNNIPGYIAIEDNISSKCREFVAKSMSMSPEERINQKNNLDSLYSVCSEELRQLRIKYGVENLFRDSYFCHLCKDKGFVEGKKCSCYKREINHVFMRSFPLKPFEKNMSPSVYSRYRKIFENKDKHFWFLKGKGDEYVDSLREVCSVADDKGMSCAFIRFNDFVELIKQMGLMSKRTLEKELIDYIQDCDFLCVSEFNPVLMKRYRGISFFEKRINKTTIIQYNAYNVDFMDENMLFS